MPQFDVTLHKLYTVDNSEKFYDYLQGLKLTATIDITGKQIIAFLRYTLFVIGIAIFAGAAITEGWNYMFWGMFLLFLSNLFFGFAEAKSRFIFLFFHVAIFTFLISRPFILVVEGRYWVWYGKEATRTALMMLFLSLLALRLGAVIGDGVLKRYEGIEERKKVPEKTGYQKAFRESLAIISLVIFLILIAMSFAEGFERLSFMQGKDYNDFFLSYESSLPGVVLTMSAMAKYAMCIFFATFPRKRAAAAVLFIYLLDALPLFIIGVRNPLVLRVIFLLIYFILRDIMDHREKWIGKLEKTLIVIGTPLLVAFLGIYSSLRLDKAVKSGFLGSIRDFFYDQGTSFDTIRSVCTVIPELPSAGGVKNYTFGPFTDYLVHGSIGQKLFGAVDIGNTNSAVKAIYGSNLAHSSYYVVNKSAYLKGWGKGSSYVLENFVDWGYAGVIIFSLVLGAVLILLLLLMKKDNTLLRTIAFTALLGIFFSPRAEATDWIVFLVYIQFWALIIVVYLLAGLCTRTYTYRNENRPIRLT